MATLEQIPGHIESEILIHPGLQELCEQAASPRGTFKNSVNSQKNFFEVPVLLEPSVRAPGWRKPSGASPVVQAQDRPSSAGLSLCARPLRLEFYWMTRVVALISFSSSRIEGS